MFTISLINMTLLQIPTPGCLVIWEALQRESSTWLAMLSFITAAAVIGFCIYMEMG